MKPALVLCLAVPLATTAMAQTPPLASFDAARMTEFSDSFTTLVRGQPRGWHRFALHRTAAGFAYVEALDVPQLMSRSIDVTLDPALAILHAADSSQLLGLPTGSDLRYTGQYARGIARVRAPGMTVRTVAIDTTFAPGTINGLALMALLPALDWQPRGSYAFSIFDSDELSVTTQRLRVVGEERITVPAGTFDAWRAELSTTDQKVLLWYTRAAPHRLVKVSSGDSVIADVLVTEGKP